MKISGIGFVYMITSPSGRIYIGSTTDIEYRWSKYYRLNCRKQVKLLNSFKKYGVENHIFEIVWAGDLLDMLKYETLIGWGFDVLEKNTGLTLRLPKLGEMYSCMSEETKNKLSNRIVLPETRLKMSISGKLKILSDKHKENIGISSKGIKNGFYGKLHSSESKKKIAASRLGKKQTEEARLKRRGIGKRPVLQYDLQGNFIKEWDSAKDAGFALKINKSGITQCCKNKYAFSSGFIWKYK